ncbi:MAG TPA: Nif3-like dinuclear metal center hexameric protein [Puia sp.]|nr:Nif3-like dinuclear metal center hexameric protein [Puia sp.]
MKISDIIHHLETIAPGHYQEEYDNSGLIAGDITRECSAVLVSLDCTEEIVKEAAEKKCSLIVSHHPLIFRPIRRIHPADETGRTLMAAIKSDIAIYAIHTNLDNIISGVNATIADRLGLINREILLPRPDQTSVGSGLIGDLRKAVPERQFLRDLKEGFNTPVIRHSPLTGKSVSRVALCGGSGSFLISSALQQSAGFFVSADIKYHAFFEGEKKMVIADIGHYESEQFTIDLLYQVILEKFPNFAVLKSGIVTNPVNYYI